VPDDFPPDHLFGLQPRRSKSFRLSTDPFLVEKVRDIVGLYLNPPDNALVLCVDEKSQVQALERTQPVLPMGLGYVEGVTHDYYRHGTTTLFAALDIVDGEIISQCKPRHRHQELLSFLKHLDANMPAHLELHLIADNYATHKHPKVKAWLVNHPRFHLHFTPTYSSWLIGRPPPIRSSTNSSASVNLLMGHNTRQCARRRFISNRADCLAGC